MTIKDGDWTLVDYDMATGRSTWGYFDGEKQHFRIDYPVENIIKENTEMRNSSAGEKFGDWRMIASVPHGMDQNLHLDEAWKNHDHAYVKKQLNDSDNRAWRTFEGNL